MPEKRVVLKYCGVIDPRDLASYLKQGGLQALEKARKEMSPQEIIETIKDSGLRGRGGAGFPCGVKWELARSSPGQEKVLICNADEGEVGTFKDRYILEHDPFSLIEGMAIAAYAIGAGKAYIYLRAEYHALLALLLDALRQARDGGFLDHLDIEVREGAGAYICGEETALMNSIEGYRGEARFRPPFPPTKGLWEQPTIINNVETLANIPRILEKGAKWFQDMGTAESKGTKVFSVSGDVERPGVYELILGSDLKELLTLAGAERIKLVQVGGATGRVVPFSMLNMPLSFETILGSGAVTVLDESRDAIDFVHRTLLFLSEESCGKCAPCREGTEVMIGVLERLAKGDGTENDIEVLETLSGVMRDASLCGLGQAAPIPVLDTIKHFRDEYETRVSQSVFLRRLRLTGA